MTEHYAWTLGPPTTTIARYYEYYVDGGDRWIVASGEADLACRITNLGKAALRSRGVS